MRLRLFVATDSRGRLTVRPSGGFAPLPVLVFQPDGLEVTVGGVDAVTLEWDAHAAQPQEGVFDPELGRLRSEGWGVDYFGANRGGRFGIAVVAGGSAAHQLAGVRAAVSPWWRRMRQRGPWAADGTVVPVVPSAGLIPSFGPERATLSALCSVIAGAPSLRSRLDEPDRMALLADSLGDRLPRGGGLIVSAGRDATDIRTAMRQSGFVHRYRRPLSISELPSLDEVVAVVDARLNRNPYRVGRPSDRALIERIVRSEFLDVTPWPFSALVDE